MNKLTALLTALTLTIAAHASASPLAVPVEDASGSLQTVFDPDISGQVLVVPLSELGGKLPADLALNLVPGTLPAGDTITLNSVTSDARNAYLNVSYHHNAVNADVNGNYWVQDMPTLALTSGGQTLVNVWMPVQTNYAASLHVTDSSDY